jgi:hypothetical protein
MAAASRIAAAGLLLVAVLLGCQPKPKAPALIDEPVYQSDEGFRFLVPEGWIMGSRANVPPGPLESERPLVQYRRTSGDDFATLEVSAMDLPENTDMVKYLSTASFSARQWTQTGRPESMEAGGAQGTRYRFSAPVKGGQLTKEVTVFRRGGRVYFFTVLFSPKDAGAAEQVRRALGSLAWTK